MDTTTLVLLVSLLCAVVSIVAAVYVYKTLQKLKLANGVGGGTGERHQRRKKDYPMSYPKGWYVIRASCYRDGV